LRRCRDSHQRRADDGEPGKALQVDHALPTRAGGVRDKQADGPAPPVLHGHDGERDDTVHPLDHPAADL
jgi:hypothetical protein